MSGRHGEPVERLIESNATAFERRLLDAAAKEVPSREMSLRMARALDVNAVVAAATTTATAVTGATTVAKATSTGGSGLPWPWIAGGLIGLSVVGVLVGRGGWKASDPTSPVAPSVSFP